MNEWQLNERKYPYLYIFASHTIIKIYITLQFCSKMSDFQCFVKIKVIFVHLENIVVQKSYHHYHKLKLYFDIKLYRLLL